MNNNSRLRKKSVNFKALTVFFWPMLTLILSITNYRKPYAKNLLWFFCIFYGMIHIVYNEQGFYVDGMSYAEKLKEAASRVNIGELVSVFYFNDVDFFMSFLIYTLAQFTDNYRILFIIIAALYGFFFSRNIWILIDEYKIKMTPFISVTIFAMVMILPIYQINGRFWLASHMFLYGALNYLLRNRSKYLIWSFLSMGVHFGMLLPVGALVICLFVTLSPIVCMMLIISSMFISGINMEVFNQQLGSILPSMYTHKLDAYANTDYLNSRLITDTKSPLIVFYKSEIFWVFRCILLIIYYFYNKIISSDERILQMFCFCAIFTSLASIVAMVPSASRYLYVSGIPVLGMLIMIGNKTHGYPFNPIIRGSLFLLLLYIVIFGLRTSMEFVGLSILYSNPLFCLFFEDNSPILFLIR